MHMMLVEELRSIVKRVVLFDTIGILVATFIFQLEKSFALGILFGSLIAVFNLLQLAITVHNSLCMNPKKAQTYTSSRYALRLLVVALGLIISIKVLKVNLLGTLIGLLSTKIAIWSNVIFSQKN